MKNADLEIWSFLTKNRGLTPWRKVNFWTKYKYSFKKLQSNKCVRKHPLRHFLGSKGVLQHAEIPRGIKKLKIPTSKFRHFCPKTIDKSIRKKSLFLKKKYIYYFKSFQFESVCPKTTPETLFRSPRDFYDTSTSQGA